MVAECRTLRVREVAVMTTLVAALMTSYVVNVAQALKPCGRGEYYDDVVMHDCRSCRIICDAVYQTPDECARRCPAGINQDRTTGLSKTSK